MKAHVVFRNVKPSLDEDIPLQCAAIICGRDRTTLITPSHIDKTLMQRTFDQVVTLGDVREQLVKVCVAFAAGHSEAGDRHEVRGNLLHIVGRVVVGPIVAGGVVASLDEGWGSGTFTGSIPGEFKRGREVVWSGWGRERPVLAVSFFDDGLFELFGDFILRGHGHGKSRDRES